MLVLFPKTANNLYKVPIISFLKSMKTIFRSPFSPLIVVEHITFVIDLSCI